jgi:hypothetical protein
MFVNRTDAVSRIASASAKHKFHYCVYGAYTLVHPGGYRRRMSRPGRYLRSAKQGTIGLPTKIDSKPGQQASNC